MYLTRLETLSTQDTFTLLRKVRLEGLCQQQIYKNSILSLEKAVVADVLIPAQRYIIKDDLEAIFSLVTLLARGGIDIFTLQGATIFWFKRNSIEEGPITITPPIVEESYETQRNLIWLINDGMHRISIARKLQLPINILLIRNVPKDLPYYALPLSNGWHDVEEINTLQMGYQKKTYRQPGSYKELFRDFNAVFPGIQKKRTFKLQEINSELVQIKE